MKLKELFTKKTAIIVGSVALMLALGFGWFVVFRSILPGGMSAEQTVAYYYRQYNAKNLRGMQSVVYFDFGNIDRQEFSDMRYIRLISCEEKKELPEGYFEPRWFDFRPVYDIAVLKVTYEVKYREGFYSVLDGSYTTYATLVKETKNSNWIIVMLGLG